MSKSVNVVLTQSQMLEIANLVAEQLKATQIANLASKAEEELEEQVKEVQEIFEEREEEIAKATPKKAIKKATKKATKKQSPLQVACQNFENEEDEEEIVEMPIAKKKSSKGSAIELPKYQEYFERALTLKNSKKVARVKCRGYVFDYEGHSLGVCYKMFVNRKKEYSKGANCWSIIDLKSGLQISKVSHLSEVENEIAEIREKLLNMYSTKEYKQKCIDFTKMPTAC